MSASARIIAAYGLQVGVVLFLICVAVMFFMVDRLRKQQGSEPILFSTQPQELRKLGDFVGKLPNKERRLVRSIALVGFVFLAAGIWFGTRGL